MALELRPNCECCDRDLPPDAPAWICSFECTFCSACTAAMANVCPNCGGDLVARPRRPAEKLAAHPPSARRVLRAGGCPGVPLDVEPSGG